MLNQLNFNKFYIYKILIIFFLFFFILSSVNSEECGIILSKQFRVYGEGDTEFIPFDLINHTNQDVFFNIGIYRRTDNSTPYNSSSLDVPSFLVAPSTVFVSANSTTAFTIEVTGAYIYSSPYQDYWENVYVVAEIATNRYCATTLDIKVLDTNPTEVCNNVDDDLDSIIDEDTELVCYTGPGGTDGVGLCHSGFQYCVSGAYGSCIGEVTPATETCNNLDDDCDSVVDGMAQACYSGPGGTQGVGICTAGSETCTAGTWGSCIGEVTPATETCNNLDDDCDSVVDGMAQACYSGPGGTQGVGLCIGGTQICSVGAWGTCVGEVIPIAEVCNSLDDDCDGVVDNDIQCGGEEEKYPDLVVSEITVSDENVMEGELVELHALVRNLGQKQSPETVLQFVHGSENGILIGELNVKELQPGTVARLDAKILLPEMISFADVEWSSIGNAGTNIIFAIVNPNRSFTEESYSNNSRTVLVNVQPALEICGNLLDDDFDGETDEDCPEEICNNSIDDDSDGEIDEFCYPCIGNDCITPVCQGEDCIICSGLCCVGPIECEDNLCIGNECCWKEDCGGCKGDDCCVGDDCVIPDKPPKDKDKDKDADGKKKPKLVLDLIRLIILSYSQKITVKDNSESLVEDARLEITFPSGKTLVLFSEEEGKVNEFTPDEKGIYSIYVTKSGYDPLTVKFNVVKVKIIVKDRVTVGQVQEILVIDEETLIPIPDVNVLIFSPGGQAITGRTGKDGIFTYKVKLEGEYKVEANRLKFKLGEALFRGRDLTFLGLFNVEDLAQDILELSERYSIIIFILLVLLALYAARISFATMAMFFEVLEFNNWRSSREEQFERMASTIIALVIFILPFAVAFSLAYVIGVIIALFEIILLYMTTYLYKRYLYSKKYSAIHIDEIRK